MSEGVIVICDDLFFWSKIQSTAAAADRPIERVTDEAGMDRIWHSGNPRRVLADLSATSVDVMAWCTRWKSRDDRPELVAFVSHVDDDAKRRARAAGFDRVLPKSRIARELPDLLR